MPGTKQPAHGPMAGPQLASMQAAWAARLPTGRLGPPLCALEIHFWCHASGALLVSGRNSGGILVEGDFWWNSTGSPDLFVYLSHCAQVGPLAIALFDSYRKDLIHISQAREKLDNEDDVFE